MVENIEIQREKTLEKLEANYAHGYINLEDFETLLEMAVNTTLPEDLERINARLKDVHDRTSSSGNRKGSSGNIRAEENFFGIMSGISRRGKWKPARKSTVYVLMGGVDLDFTQAQFPPGDIDIEFFCLMGGLDIIVPHGINVDLKGIPIMGGIESKVHEEYSSGKPTITIHGVVLMGGVEVKSR
jgi:hypothetical protein